MRLLIANEEKEIHCTYILWRVFGRLLVLSAPRRNDMPPRSKNCWISRSSNLQLWASRDTWKRTIFGRFCTEKGRINKDLIFYNITCRGHALLIVLGRQLRFAKLQNRLHLTNGWSYFNILFFSLLCLLRYNFSAVLNLSDCSVHSFLARLSKSMKNTGFACLATNLSFREPKR